MLHIKCHILNHVFDRLEHCHEASNLVKWTNCKFNAVVKRVFILLSCSDFILTINWATVKATKESAKEDCLCFKKHCKVEDLHIQRDLAVQIATNSSSSCTLIDRILAALTFKSIISKKIRINFLKYASVNLFSIFHLQFKASLLELNVLVKVNLFNIINGDIARTIHHLIGQLCAINSKLKANTAPHVTIDEWCSFEHGFTEIKSTPFLDLRRSFYYITKDLEVVEWFKYFVYIWA